MPFASGACGPDVPGGKSLPKVSDSPRCQCEAGPECQIGAKRFADLPGSVSVTGEDAVVVAMTIGLAQHRLADVVRALNQDNILADVQSVDNQAVTGHEIRRVALAEIGQHAKQMVRTDRNGHETLMAAIAAEPKSPRSGCVFPATAV